jgi:hypothetical protein
MARIVPAIPIMKMKCAPNRDRRDEPGDDVCECVDPIGRCPMWAFDKIEISFNSRSNGADIAVVSATRQADFCTPPGWR